MFHDADQIVLRGRGVSLGADRRNADDRVPGLGSSDWRHRPMANTFEGRNSTLMLQKRGGKFLPSWETVSSLRRSLLH
jgi:hypothetical protein